MRWGSTRLRSTLGWGWPALLLGCVAFERAEVPVPGFTPDGAAELDASVLDGAARVDGASVDAWLDATLADREVDPPRPDASPQDDGTPLDDSPPLDEGLPLDAAELDRGLPDLASPDLAVADAAPPDAAPACVDEVCNGLDDDCDGEVDEAFDVGDECDLRVGQRCEVRGVVQCGPDGQATCGVPPDETLREREARVRNCNCDVMVNPENVDRHVLCRRPMAWADADAFCRALGTQLWVVDDFDEWSVVSQGLLLQGGGRLRFWVGLSDQAEEGRFEWVDGRAAEAGYTPWNEGEPNNWMGDEDCVEVNRDVQWRFNDQRCQTESGFVCEALGAL